jgi:hypothetical protein
LIDEQIAFPGSANPTGKEYEEGTMPFEAMREPTGEQERVERRPPSKGRHWTWHEMIDAAPEMTALTLRRTAIGGDNPPDDDCVIYSSMMSAGSGLRPKSLRPPPRPIDRPRLNLPAD